MLKLNSSKPSEIIERMIATGVTIGSEGVPLINVIENNTEHVKTCTGVAGEVFVGFSYMHNVVPTVLSMVEEIKIPDASPYTVQLSRNNLVAGQISGRNLTTHFVIDATLAAGKFQVDETTGVLTFHSDDAGRVLNMTYKYRPTVLEAKMMYPEANININPAFEFLGKLGVIIVGEVYTDQFDAAVDWTTAGNNIYLGNGILTNAGNVKLGAHVTHAPSIDNPFLGVQFSNH